MQDKKKIYQYYLMEGEAYHQQRSIYSHVSRQKLLDKILSLQEQYLHDHDTCLDVGCAEGLITRKFAINANLAIGLDISLPKLYRAWKQSCSYDVSNIHFLQADAEHIPIGDETINFVLCIETLEHIPNHIKALTEINRVLKRGGVLVLSVPYYYVDSRLLQVARNLFHKLKNLKSRNAFDPFASLGDGHLHNFSPTSLLSLLQKNNFGILVVISHSPLKTIFNRILALIKSEIIDYKSKWVIVVARKTHV